ncbi:MAG: PepSY domain-containing protein [Pseudolabrys sp.]|nr:PepSY domain-containing protein [Pseudolabrys sp.]
MWKPWLLRIHRWTTLVFAIPLIVVIVTGLILSFEPIVTGATTAPVTADTLTAVLAKHDPAAKARSLFVRAYDGTVSIGGEQRGQLTHVDLASNEKIASPGFLANLFSSSRRLHENFLFNLRWVVTASTIAMLTLVVLGVLMGWPRLRNSLAGWHKGTGWFLLPFLILSPLTGLALAFGITFSAPLPRAAAAVPLQITEATRIIAREHNLAQLSWIRSLGGALMARLDDNGEMKLFAITRDGLKPAARNWPRLLHEGNWSRYLSSAINVVISLALVLLLTTGLWMWARRKFRRRTRPA